VRNELIELWKYRHLLWLLVRRDLKVRYKNSRLGFFWSIAPPLMQVIVINFAMRRATTFASGFESYQAFLLVAIIPWTYFNGAILDSSQSILQMLGVIRKVYFPREIIPLANAISNFIHFLLSWVVFLIYWWGVARGPILLSTLWFPYLLLVQFMLTTGLSLIVSCLNVFYEDVKYIVSILLNLGLFLLPIIYVVEQPYYAAIKAGGGLLYGIGFDIYMLNPLTSLITGYRKALLESPRAEAIGGPSLPLDPVNLLITGLISFGVLVGSYIYFNRRKWQFVERP
jgi:lipopolysaccharide transport system permease protein